MSAEFPCPRHGRDLPSDTPGLRCDCLKTVETAAGPLRRGKWVAAAILFTNVHKIRALDQVKGILDAANASSFFDALVRELDDVVEESANTAVTEALMAGYRLGLAGGVPASRVRTCERCREPFVTCFPDTPGPPLCMHCYVDEGGI